MSGFSQRSEALSSVEVLARFQAAIVGGSSVILGSTGLPVRNAATQDAITLLGRAGGTSSYQCKLTPAVLSATQTVTFPDATFTVAGLQIADQTFTGRNVINNQLDIGQVGGATSAYNIIGFGRNSSTGAMFSANLGGIAIACGGSTSGVSPNAVTFSVFNAAGSVLADAIKLSTVDGKLTLSPSSAALETPAIFTNTNATASTSTTTGAVTIPNGGLGVGGAITAGGQISTTGATSQIFEAKTSSAASFSVLRLTNTGASGRTYDFAAGGSATSYLGGVGLYDGTAGALRFNVGPTGGFYIGNTYQDPGQGNLTVQNAIRSTSPTAGIGYGTGAGGTVTQATSKSTGVTLNTVCGTITMNGAALASATSVAFVFTNSAIAATDKVEVDHDSAGTLCAYNICVTPAAGSATVTVRNMTAGSLSEAIVLRFFVQKAAIS